MKYRKFGKLDWEVSVLGFGAARLPSSEDNPDSIDEVETANMLRYAIDSGVNYLDLGYPYDLPRQKQISRIIGHALQDGYREKIKMAATLPSSLVDVSADFGSNLDRQLDWLQTDSIDFFLLGGLNRETWPLLQGMDIIKQAEAARNDGRIKEIGFSFHDHFQTLREIIDAYDDWVLARFQYSYMDVDHHPGIGGLRYADGKGLAVVVTEPLRWGRLTKEPPGPVAKVWAEAPPGRSLAGWGLDWVWSHPEVAAIVSDMSSLDQLKENVGLADNAEPGSLTISEQIIIGKVRDAYRTLKPMMCTACRGCMPCPVGIDVPRIFELYNDALMYKDVETGRYLYKYEGHDINGCTECGSCAAACGFKLPIMEWLKKARELLD